MSPMTREQARKAVAGMRASADARGVWNKVCNRCDRVVGGRLAEYGKPEANDLEYLACPDCGNHGTAGAGFRVEFSNPEGVPMFDPLKLKADLLALEAAVLNPSVSGLLRATAAVEGDAADAWDMFSGVPTNPNSMKGTPDAAACKDLCDRITAACQKPRVFATDPVGKIGDGTILKLILTNLPAILAFISAFL